MKKGKGKRKVERPFIERNLAHSAEKKKKKKDVEKTSLACSQIRRLILIKHFRRVDQAR